MKALVVAALVLGASVAHAQPTRLSPNDFTPGPLEAQAPDVDLVTFGVGDRIFEKFGHAALCLRYHDPEKLPVCFNYGVTDFDAGSVLAWRFLRGEQEFWVEPESISSLMAFYEWEDRDIWVQTLPLDERARRVIEAKLWSDLEAENKFYIYDHLYDNCTTRLRDLLDAATSGRLGGTRDERYPLTFRELGERGLASAEPLVGLADFIVGRTLDAHPTRWEAMFHPEILRLEVADKLGAPAVQVNQRQGPAFATSGHTGRWLFLVLAAVFALPLALARWRGRFERAAAAWAALYLGLWGLVIWTLVIISSIPGVRWNEVALVLVPFDLALPFLGAERRRRYARWRVIGLLAVSILCGLGMFHQPLWVPVLTAFAPLALLGFG